MSVGLDDDTRTRLAEVLAEEPEISRALLFGSRAKGTNRSGSDLDLCLEGRSISHGTLSRLESAIDDLLLPWEVDLVAKADINNPQLLEHIERVGVVIFQAT